MAPYCDLYGGIVINMAINLRQKITGFFGEHLFDFNNGMAGKNVFPLNANPNFTYNILEEYGLDDMHQIKFESLSDGLLEAGLGSSAAAAVAILGMINKRKNLGMSLDDIAEKAWELEVNKLKLFGGKQDQYCAAYGGINIMEFRKDKVTVIPLARGFIEKLLPSLCLFYTGQNRKSATIQEGFKKLSQYQIDNLNNIKGLALTAMDPIASGDIEMVGYMLNQTWEYKKHSNKGVSNPRIDNFYRVGIKNGALGGKILGAGGGGYMLFIVPPEKKAEFIQTMEKQELEWWDFSPCWQGLEVRELP